MGEEIIFCIDMQRNYESCYGFPRGYASACVDIEKFSATAAEIGIPTWNILTTDESWLRDEIFATEMEADLRRKQAKKYTDIFADGDRFPDMPLVFKHSFNAFTNKSLQSALVQAEARKIWLIGHHAEECVVETAVGALKNGFEVGVIADLAFGDHSLIGGEVGMERLRRFYENRLAPTPLRGHEIDMLNSRDFLDQQRKRPAFAGPRSSADFNPT